MRANEKNDAADNQGGTNKGEDCQCLVRLLLQFEVLDDLLFLIGCYQPGLLNLLNVGVFHVPLSKEGLTNRLLITA